MLGRGKRDIDTWDKVKKLVNFDLKRRIKTVVPDEQGPKIPLFARG
jgi:hypothetical protein